MRYKYKRKYCKKCEMLFGRDENFCPNCGKQFGKNDFKEDLTNPEGYSCFVATACYGDCVITKSLRDWRDKQVNFLSLAFIKLYYAGIGKLGAEVLEVFPKLKPLAKIAIKMFMKTLKIK